MTTINIPTIRFPDGTEWSPNQRFTSPYSIDASKKPGPQDPGKYNETGPNYSKFGEQVGFLYNPQDDRYYADPREAKNFSQSNHFTGGDTSQLQQAGGLLGGAALLGLGGALGRDPIGTIDGGASKIGNLLGLGGGGGSGSSLDPFSYSLTGGSDGAPGSVLGQLPGDGGTLGLGADDSGLSPVMGFDGGGSIFPGAADTGAGLDVLGNAGALGLGPIAGILGATALGGKSLYDEAQGKSDNSIPGFIGRGSADIATGGLAEIPRALGLSFGHGQNYTDAQDRGSALNQLSGGTGDLSLAEKGGGTFNLTKDQIMHDPNSYNNDMTNPDFASTYIPQANPLAFLADQSGSNTNQQQLTSTFANALQQGVSPLTLAQQSGFSSFDQAKTALDNSSLDDQTKQIYLQGLMKDYGQG